MGAQNSKQKKEDTSPPVSIRQDAIPLGMVYKPKNQVSTPTPNISAAPDIFSNNRTPFNQFSRATVPARSQMLYYGSMTCGSCTSYDALSGRNLNSIGINPGYGRPAIEQPPRKDVKLNLYETFLQARKELSTTPDEIQRFKERVYENTDKLQKQRHEQMVLAARLKREEEKSKMIVQRESENKLPSVFSCLSIRSRLANFKKSDSKYFPIDKFPELTSEMMAVIKDASRPYPEEEALVELDGVQILRKDINTLLGLNWLNDEIINAYMTLLVLRGKQYCRKRVYAFNTFFYPKLRSSGYSAIKRWTRKVDIFSHDFLLVPVHLGNHWCLAFIDFATKTISYFDSMGGHSGGCCNTLLEYLKQESLDKRKQSFGNEGWKLIERTDIPKQHNCSDCGVFACTYAEYLTRPAKFNFKQDDMPYFRKKMIYEIIMKKIL